MLRCRRCEREFEPGHNGQVVCDVCTDENPLFANLASMAAEYESFESLTFEEVEQQRILLEEEEMRKNPFLDD